MKKEKQEKQAISKAKIVMGLVATLLLLALLATVSVVVVKNKQQDDLNSNTNVTGEIFTVAFESNGGSAVDSLVGIAKGNKIVKPASPTKPNFSFVGWYKDAELLTEYIFETDVVNTNFTLYAKWEDKAAHVHAYGEWVITTPATCTTAGEKTKTCACGDKVTEIIPATGHSYSDWVITTLATCTTAGERTKTCACGEVITEVVHALRHRYGEWVIKTPATCTTAGKMTRTCIECGYVETGVIHATGIHTYGDWDITKPATCTTAGERTKTCACGEAITEVVPAPGHRYGELVTTETGATRECSVCHHKEDMTYAEGLQYGDVDVDGTMVHMVTGIGTETAAKVICIPKTHGGKPVGGIDVRAFENCTSLTAITIPSGVTSIRYYAFSGCTNLATVTFEAGSKLASIFLAAFYGCSSLAAITLPSSVTSILGSDTWGPNGAFYGCTSLTSITIPRGVTSIGRGAFDGCTALASIEVDLANANYQSIDGNLYNKAGTTLVLYAPGKTETSFNVPSSVTSILGSDEYGVGAFSGCKNLATVTFAADSKLIAIGNRAFSGCTSLAAITIPSSVTSIGEYAFRWCNLATVTFAAGSKLTSIGDNAFSGCTALAAIIIPSSVTSIEYGAFDGCTALASITIPSSVTSIGNGAFDGCTALTSIAIPSSVTCIEGNTYSKSGAFDGCTALTIYAEAARQPSGWNSDWNYSYCPVVWNCSTNDVANDGYIYTLQDGVRYGIKNGVAMVARQPSTITTANIAANITYQGITYAVTSIRSYAFDGCTSLTSITIPSGVTFIGSYAFKGCTSLTSITVDPANANYQSIEGNLYNKAGTELIQYAIGKTATSFSIPSSVTSIVPGAFYGCTSLASVTIPSGVTSIGQGAFYGCTALTIYAEAAEKPTGWGNDWNITYNNRRVPVRWAQNNITTNVDYDYIVHNDQVYLTKYKGSSLAVVVPETIDGKPVVSVGGIFCGTQITSISLPSGVTSIGDEAFYNCKNLATVIFAAGSTLTSIEVYAFYDCTKLTTVTFEAGSLLTSIGGQAFKDCFSLAAITIPSGVTCIEDGAFYGCTALTIYAEAAEKPTGWGNDWNITYNNRRVPVRWAQNNITTNVDYDYTVHNDQVYLTKYKGSSLAVVVPETIDGKPVVSVGEIFGGTQITSISLPSSVTSILGGDAYVGGAFGDCTNLATVTFEAGSKLASIGQGAFGGCTSLTSIIIPSSVTSIERYAFLGCTKLATVTFAAGSQLTSIGGGAFGGCTALASITIPSSVTSVGSGAFSVCTSLTIYAEAAGQPTGWVSDWNSSNRPVYWYRETATTGSGYWHYVDGVPTKW